MDVQIQALSDTVFKWVTGDGALPSLLALSLLTNTLDEKYMNLDYRHAEGDTSIDAEYEAVKLMSNAVTWIGLRIVFACPMPKWSDCYEQEPPSFWTGRLYLHHIQPTIAEFHSSLVS